MANNTAFTSLLIDGAKDVPVPRLSASFSNLPIEIAMCIRVLFRLLYYYMVYSSVTSLSTLTVLCLIEVSIRRGSQSNFLMKRYPEGYAELLRRAIAENRKKGLLFLSWAVFKELLFVTFVNTVRQFKNPSIITLFWWLYFVVANPVYFCQNFTAAWAQKLPTMSISIFIDNSRHQRVPCDGTWSDKELLLHLVSFYDVARSSGIPFEALGYKTIRRIEIAKLQDGLVVGKRLDVLHLGAYGPENRPISYFRNPDALPDNNASNTIDWLKNNNVLLENNATDRNCLNIVRTYKASYISIAVLIPTISSIVVGIAWTIVAVRKFEQDVQVSAQTGFTIASYIATAGAILIALVAYMEGRFEAGFKDSQDFDKNDHSSSPLLSRSMNSQTASSAATPIHSAFTTPNQAAQSTSSPTNGPGASSTDPQPGSTSIPPPPYPSRPPSELSFVSTLDSNPIISRNVSSNAAHVSGSPALSPTCSLAALQANSSGTSRPEVQPGSQIHPENVASGNSTTVVEASPTVAVAAHSQEHSSQASTTTSRELPADIP